MKIVGLDYFGLDYKTISIIDSKINIFPINYIINFVLLITQLYFLTYIITLKKPKIIELAIVTLINVLSGVLVFILKMDFLYSIISFLILVIYFKIKKSKFKKIFKVLIINTILQIISAITRNNTFVEYNFALSLILDIDYMLMLLIYYKIVKEGINLCQYQIHGLSSLKKINLKKLLTKLQEKSRNFRKLDKITKLTYIIYFILSLIWNTLSVVFIENYLDDRYNRECHYSKTIGEFAKEYPYGKYAVTTNGHITAIIDGIIYDTFDPSDRIMRCAWRIK